MNPVPQRGPQSRNAARGPLGSAARAIQGGMHDAEDIHDMDFEPHIRREVDHLVDEHYLVDDVRILGAASSKSSTQNSSRNTRR